MKKTLVISSLIYKTVERFSVKGLGFIIGILLARLLSPEAYGQIAIINVFVNLSQSIIEGGLGTALVQNKDTDDGDYSTVFFICMAMSLVMTTIVFIAAPFIANYYSSPEILVPLRIYAFSVFFSSYGSILTAKIQREMRFKQMLVCSLTATVISGSLAVALAFSGAGIWTLVVYYFSHTVVNCMAMMIAVHWVPKLSFSVTRAKTLYSFGWKMLAASMMCSLYYDLRSLIIGKRFSTADLGYYDRGQQFPFTIHFALDASIQSVIFPVLSKSQDNREEMRSIMRKTLGLGAVMIFPAMMGLAAVAEPLIRLLLTDKWLPCVPFMQIICFAQVPSFIISSNLVALKSTGRSDMYMKLEFFRRLLMLVVLALTVLLFDSVIAMAYSYALSSWIDLVVVIVSNNRLIGYRLIDQLKDVWPAAPPTLIMTALVYALNYVPLPLILKLCVQILGGILIYIILCKVFRVKMFNYVLDMLKDMRSKNKTA